MISLFRCEPCPVIANGKLCGKTQERPLVYFPYLGWGCRDHRPSLTPKEVKQ